MKFDKQNALRNYEIGRIQSCLDGLKVVWLAHIATVDSLPIGLIALGAFIYLVYRSSQYRFNFTQTADNLQARYRLLFGLPRKTHFAYADDVGGTSYTIGTYVSDWIVMPKSAFEADALDLIAHEATHVKRGDHAIKWAFDNVSHYLMFVIFLLPVSVWISLGFKFPPASWLPSFFGYWTLLALPGLYLYLTRERHSHNREFVADAEAALFAPDAYLQRMAALERRERFGEVNSANGKRRSHPDALERYSRVSGARRIPFKELIGAIAMIGLIVPFLGINTILGFVYTPGASATIVTENGSVTSDMLSFEPIRFAINIALTVLGFHLIAKVCGVISSGFRSGLSRWEKLSSVLVFVAISLPGFLFYALSAFSVFNTIFGSKYEVLYGFVCLALAPYIFILINFLATSIFRRCGSPIFLFWISFLALFITPLVAFSLKGYSGFFASLAILAAVIALDALPRVFVKETRSFDGARMALRPILRTSQTPPRSNS